jgi:hypothetical protein
MPLHVNHRRHVGRCAWLRVVKLRIRIVKKHRSCLCDAKYHPAYGPTNVRSLGASLHAAREMGFLGLTQSCCESVLSGTRVGRAHVLRVALVVSTRSGQHYLSGKVGRVTNALFLVGLRSAQHHFPLLLGTELIRWSDDCVPLTEPYCVYLEAYVASLFGWETGSTRCSWDLRPDRSRFFQHQLFRAGFSPPASG